MVTGSLSADLRHGPVALRPRLRKSRQTKTGGGASRPVLPDSVAQGQRRRSRPTTVCCLSSSRPTPPEPGGNTAGPQSALRPSRARSIAIQRMLLAASNPQRSPFFSPLAARKVRALPIELEQFAPGHSSDLAVADLLQHRGIGGRFELRKDFPDKRHECFMPQNAANSAVSRHQLRAAEAFIGGR